MSAGFRVAMDDIYAKVNKPRRPSVESDPELPSREPRAKPKPTRMKPRQEVYENLEPAVPQKSKEVIKEMKKQKKREKSGKRRKPKKKTQQPECSSETDRNLMAVQREIKSLMRGRPKDDISTAADQPLANDSAKPTDNQLSPPAASEEQETSVYELAKAVDQQVYDDIVADEQKAVAMNRPKQENKTGKRPKPEPRKQPPACGPQPLALYDNLGDIKANENKQPEDYIYEEAAVVDTSKVRPQQARNKMSADRSKCPPETVIVDKRYYNYMCEFRIDVIEAVQKECRLEFCNLDDENSKEILVRFTGSPRGQKQFLDAYNRLIDDLVLENVPLTGIENARQLVMELESAYQCLTFNGGNNIEVLCRLRDVDQVCSKIEEYRTNAKLPVGYDIGGVYCVYIYQMDITKLNVDAITNAADEHLQHAEGVAKVIADAAGPKLIEESRKVIQRRPIPITKVVKTTAGKLPCKVVLHAVVPRLPKRPNEKKNTSHQQQLKVTFCNVLEAAHQDSYGSVALPPVNPDIFGVPAGIVVKALKDAVLESSLYLRRSKLKEVHVVDTRQNILKLLAMELTEGLHRVADGKQVAVKELPMTEVKRALSCPHRADKASYSRKLSKFTCGLGRKK